MSRIPLTRAQFLLPFAQIHDEIGAPTEALLVKFRLPAALDEKADHYVPILPAIEFAQAAQRAQGITDFGFQAAQRVEFCHLSEKLRALIAHSPTLLAALRQVCRWAPIEDTNLMMWLERADGCARICSRLDGTAGLFHLEHSQWLQIIFPIHIVRQFAGPDWSPRTIAFEARYTPSLNTQAFWPNTRFLSGQSASWIDVPASFLSLPNLSPDPPPMLQDNESGPPDVDLVATLKLMLPSYLDQGLPTAAEVAEIAGISLRSFQRKLVSLGHSYSSLVDVVRFENAARLLRETDTKIIEIAFANGYADPAHFTRAFRRVAGVTPRAFREQWQPR